MNVSLFSKERGVFWLSNDFSAVSLVLGFLASPHSLYGVLHISYIMNALEQFPGIITDLRPEIESGSPAGLSSSVREYEQ